MNELRREQQILDEVKSLPDKSKPKVLEFIIGYMLGSNSGKRNATSGYVAFMEGMEYAIIEYRDE